MRYAIIIDGQVDNIVLAEEDVALERGWIACPAEVSRGWTFTGEAFEAPPPRAPTVPQEVDMAQARLALLSVGLLDQVSAAIDALPSPQREAALIEWEYRTKVRRNSDLVAGLAPALGLDDEQLDNLFQQAARL